jgi:hypothetical protein
MRLADFRGGAAVLVACIVAAAVFGLQFVTGAPVFGIAGIAALLVPGFLISRALIGATTRWPLALLTTLSVTLILIVLIGLVAALTPRGLTPVTVAVFEHTILTLLLATWLWITWRSQTAASRQGRAEAAAARGPRSATRPNLARGSVVLVTTGLLLATMGVAVAVGAANGQQHAGYLQLWSVESAAASEPVVGVQNATGAPLDCNLALTHVGAPAARWAIEGLEDGGTWFGGLPARTADEVDDWLLDLVCTSADGTTLERRLRIEPPA